jgi:hydrogenase large subunit
MNARVVVDPITRIEGHLRIEAQMDGDQIAQAYSSGTMVRGIEIILRDRDPRDAWAFAQRICGVCTLVHGIASVRAVENAIGAKVPQNAELIRNLMIGAQYIHDHVMHFYHLHALDWVDVVSALSADPAKTAELAQSLGSYPRSSVVLGTSRIPPAPRGKSHGGCTLPGCARLAARRCETACHIRRQESAPELPRRRRALAHRPEL